MTNIGINMSVLPETQDETLRVFESLSRTAAGLALDGITVQLTITPYEPEDEEE